MYEIQIGLLRRRICECDLYYLEVPIECEEMELDERAKKRIQ